MSHYDYRGIPANNLNLQYAFGPFPLRHSLENYKSTIHSVPIYCPLQNSSSVPFVGVTYFGKSVNELDPTRQFQVIHAIEET